MARRSRPPRNPGEPPAAPPAQTPAPARRRRSLLGRLLAWLLITTIWSSVALVALLAWFAWDLPDLHSAAAVTRRPGLTFVAADGQVIAQLGDVYGQPVRLDDLPPALPQAILATEDRRFFDHKGIDPVGLGRALVANLRAGRVVQGGSTLTQQLAKNLFLTPERSLKRKVQELLMALWLEQAFTKEQIFTLYLNRVYLGAGTYGVDAAARRYFDVAARDLSLYQAAMLAGLLKAPSRYNPVANPKLAHARTTQVLANMVAAGFLSQAEAEAVAEAGGGIVWHRPAGGRYFVDWLTDQVDDYVSVADRDLVVVTTLDLGVQLRAEAILKAALEQAGPQAQAGQGAVVVMAPDGAVRAMVGGRDYGSSQFNRATQALRQPGSAFKPVVYLAGLEAGLTPETVMDDRPLRLGKWAPGNFDNRFRGPVSLTQALAESVNTVAVRVSEQAGRKAVIAAARRLGLTGRLPDDASIALGTGEVSLLELTGAYATLANGGNGLWPFGITEIRERSGAVLYRRSGSGPGRVVAAETVADLNTMLAAVLTQGTGKAAALGRPAAGKTGTTQDYRDAWFMGYTADLAAGVWIGNDDHSPMRRVSGGGLPAKVWREVMEAAHGGLPPRPLAGRASEDEPVSGFFRRLFGG